VEAWAEIDAQATRSLTAALSARKVVDVKGPMGTDFAERSIEGPYVFVAGPEIRSTMSAHVQGYPVKMQAENVLGGSFVLSP